MTVSPVYQARPHKAAEARTRAYWAEMMRDDDLAAEIGGRFDHILVDEYQDYQPAAIEDLVEVKA